MNGFWYFFGRNVTHKVSNQKTTLYYATSNNLRFCTTWQNGKHENYIFHSLYQCISRIQPAAAWFLQPFWLTTNTQAAAWLPKSSNQCVQLGAFVRHGSGERKSRALQQLDCVACAQSTSALSFGFPISQDNDEALDSWGGKTKHRLISYFISNTSAKNYRSPIMYVKIIASHRWDVFWGTS